jgi:hypothetical protein
MVRLRLSLLALASTTSLLAGCCWLSEHSWFHRKTPCCESAGCCETGMGGCEGPMLGNYGPMLTSQPMNGSILTAPTPLPVPGTAPLPTAPPQIRPVPQPPPQAQPQAYNPIR